MNNKNINEVKSEVSGKVTTKMCARLKHNIMVYT